eukprot:g2583.t1
MMSSMNMSGNYSFRSPITIAPDEKIKLEIIKLSNAIERSIYPCVYFCNLYGHSFHLTNGKMKQYIKSETPNMKTPVPVTQVGNNRAVLNSSSKQKNTSNAYSANNAGNSGGWQKHNQPESPFKRMIDSVFHCSNSKKNEIASTFMENALMKSNQVVKTYFDDMPPIPSFETTFTYDNIPIFDYQASALKETTLLVNLSRTMNGEMFIHKVHFTNVRGRVMNLPSNFVSTNRFGIDETTNNFTGAGNKSSIAINKCYQNTIANKNNLHDKVSDTASVESKATSQEASSNEMSSVVSPAPLSQLYTLTGANGETTANRSSTSPTSVNSSNESKTEYVNAHNDKPLKGTQQQFDGNKLKKYLPNVVLNNIFG